MLRYRLVTPARLGIFHGRLTTVATRKVSRPERPPASCDRYQRGQRSRRGWAWAGEGPRV